jgi:hypothetical protein
MKSKWPGIFIMGAMSLALMSLIDVLVAKQTLAGLPSLWVSWCVSLALTGFVAWKAVSVRHTWGLLSLVNGGLSFAVVLANAVLPASASAPYEPGSDWLRSIDFTPPIAARLREALAAGYFAIAMIVAGMMFVAAAYLLWHLWDDSTRHAR